MPVPQTADPWAAAGFVPEMPADTAPSPAGRQRIVITPGDRQPADPWAAAGFHEEGSPEVAAAAEPKKPFGLMDTWPVRLAMHAKDAFAGAMKVASGELGPEDPEAIKAVTDLASILGPINPAVRAGAGWMNAGREIQAGAQARPGAVAATDAAGNPIAGQALADTGPFRPQVGAYRTKLRAPPGATPGQGAALTANELVPEGGLPIGLVSANPAVQAVTQAARKIPGVGTGIDTKVGKVVTAAGERVNEMADTLGGGVVNRTQAGANMRPSLQGVIDSNNKKINESFDDLRSIINPDKVVRIARQKNVQLPRTKSTLQKIVDARLSAGNENPVAGLNEIDRLSTYGASFNGLQRARHDISNTIKFGKANPGFDAGDLKRLYGAMTADMYDIARAARKSGVKVGDVSDSLRSANSVAAQHIQHNEEIEGLLNVKTDEGLIGSLVKSAQGKTGNFAMLARLRATMPADQFEQISGVALHELGMVGKGGAVRFSLTQFSKKWDELGSQAKAVLFTPQHRGFLENVAQLGKYLGDADKYISTGSAPTNSLLAIAAGIGTALSSGDPVKMAGVLATGGAGYALAKILARPAGAASFARWSRAAIRYKTNPSATTKAAVTVAARSLIPVVEDTLGLSGGQRLAPALDAQPRIPANAQ